MTMSRRSGCVTGLGTPGIQETGLTLAYRSSAFRNATFKDRKPTLTGVVSGPFSPTTYSRIAPRVASGSMSPYWNIARSPAGTGYQPIRRRPPKAPATAASIAVRAARTTSGPMPSPSISGMMGSSGTRSPLSAIRILWPTSGGRRTRRSDGMPFASRTLVDGHVLEVFRARIPVERPQEAIVLPILDDLSRPAGNPGDGEDRGEQVRRDPQVVEDEARIEVHVRVDVFRRERPHDRVLDDRRDPVVRVVSAHLREAMRVILEDERPRVVRLVDAMSEPEDFLLVPQCVQDELLCGLRTTDPLDCVQGGHDRPELGDESTGLAHVRRARHVVPFGVETVHVRDGRPEDIHRWRVLGHRTEQPQDGRGKGPRGPQVGLRLLELFPIREMSLQEEEDGLLERRVRGEIADVVPAVQEAPSLAVDEAD